MFMTKSLPNKKSLAYTVKIAYFPLKREGEVACFSSTERIFFTEVSAWFRARSEVLKS